MSMPSAAGATVLVVDDTRINRVVVETNLTQQGYLVISAEGGQQALDILPAGDADADAGKPNFDAVVLDIMMPEIDGIMVLKALRKTRSPIELPVIMATAMNRSEDIVQALQSGANDYVTKPIDMPVLLARLQTQIVLKRSHESLRAAQRSLIDAAKMESVGVLAAGVAHEIRNPLAQILMASDGLATLEAVKNDESGRVLAQVMSDAVTAADSIVKRLMAFSSSMKLSLEERKLNALIRETLEMLEDDLAASKTELDLRLAESLPTLRIAPAEMRKVLINLVLNGIQAMPDGGRLTVTTGLRPVEGLPLDEGSRSGIRLRNGAEACFIEIEDTGTGIDPADLDSVFDAFFTTKATGSGTGLGLTVARKIVDLHGGLIRIENQTGRTGARITILLPLDKATGAVV